jgi:hypothetical protein
MTKRQKFLPLFKTYSLVEETIKNAEIYIYIHIYIWYGTNAMQKHELVMEGC